MNQLDLVLGDDFMALYVNKKKVVEGVKLTFADILEHCGLPCNIWTAELEFAYKRTNYPEDLDHVEMEPEPQV